MSTVPKWWWLSFADARRPKGTQFLGVVIVRGLDAVGACRQAHELAINPGGEVQCHEFPDTLTPPPDWCRGRLLTREEAERIDAELAE